ncbi:hypothetical protein GOV09_00815 [Candidatus Woesearchaeota archaeon]|nr:hypothetical protein [Candidatus Woesearchaeota archaeon]
MPEKYSDGQTENEWRDLAPEIFRQRAIIEATTQEIVKPDEMKDYMTELARALNMDILAGPVAYSAHELGYGGWAHWRTSGVHVYSYPSNPPLFTVDIYTCKAFELETAIQFTKDHLSTLEILAKSI